LLLISFDKHGAVAFVDVLVHWCHR